MPDNITLYTIPEPDRLPHRESLQRVRGVEKSKWFECDALYLPRRENLRQIKSIEESKWFECGTHCRIMLQVPAGFFLKTWQLSIWQHDTLPPPFWWTASYYASEEKVLVSKRNYEWCIHGDRFGFQLTTRNVPPKTGKTNRKISFEALKMQRAFCVRLSPSQFSLGIVRNIGDHGASTEIVPFLRKCMSYPYVAPMRLKNGGVLIFKCLSPHYRDNRDNIKVSMAGEIEWGAHADIIRKGSSGPP
jgi:hypothetical protein